MTPLAVLCALVSLLLVGPFPAHAPIAFVLCASTLRDLAGPVLRGSPVDDGLLAALAAAQGWAYWRAWAPNAGPVGRALIDASGLWAAGIAFVAGGISPGAVSWVFGLSCGAGLLAWLFRDRQAEEGPAADAAAVLLVGDACAVVLGWRRDAVELQAAIQLAVATVVQAAWLVTGPARVVR